MKKKLIAAVAIVAAIAVGFGAGSLYAAGNAGSREDPLITQSYLTDTFKPALELYINAKVTEALASVSARVEQAVADRPEETDTRDAGFYLVTLYRNQTLKLTAGAEALLRDGTATASSALTDVSEGAAVESGAAIALNRMYFANADGGISVTSEEATLLVSGSYEIAT